MTSPDSPAKPPFSPADSRHNTLRADAHANDSSRAELTRAEQKLIRELHSKKGRREQRRFLVEGGKSVAELLASDWPVVAVYASHEAAPDLRDAAARRGLPLLEISQSLLTSLGTYEHNDSALAVAGWRERGILPALPGELVLVLDDIRDPGNFGTIIRSADWYGIRQIVCSPETAELYSPKVIAASMGSFLRVSVTYTALPAYLQRCQVPVFGALMSGRSVYGLPLKAADGAVLVIGNEAHGPSEAVAACVTQAVTIPRFGAAESLNAGIATAILLDHWARHRHA